MDTQEIIQKLHELRSQLAIASKQELFKILHNRTIDAIAVEMPRTMDELLRIKGIGKKKAAQFGEQILAIINGDAPENGRLAFGKSKQKIFSVSSFLDHINQILQEEHAFVQGEISGFQLHPSGIYFSLKDKDNESVMNCYLRPWIYRNLGVTLEDGMEIKIGGILNIYKPKGRSSFLVESLELVGEGSLKKAYELLKQKLEAEGLFARKRQLPEFISRIGLITSKTGAVIGDFRKNLKPLGAQIDFYDVRVEGDQAVREITRAIKWFNRHKPDLDVLVIIRGGGSLEDLQAFNNERVVREIFISAIPTICGIGHDRDIPIASLTADRETSTPSIAAMLINDSWRRLYDELPRQSLELISSFERACENMRSSIRHTAEVCIGYIRQVLLHSHALRDRMLATPQRIEMRLHQIAEKYRGTIVRIMSAFQNALAQNAERIKTYESYLAVANPERNLRLGYSIIFTSQGRVVHASRDVHIGEKITSRLSDGEFTARVEEIRKK